MPLESISCVDCRERIGYIDNFGIGNQILIGSYVCKKCYRDHKNLGVTDIDNDALTKLRGSDSTEK